MRHQREPNRHSKKEYKTPTPKPSNRRPAPPEPTRATATAAILEEKHISLTFPEPTQAAARSIPSTVRPSDRKGRTDLREELIFTIDGDTSKDFDDAVSLTPSADGTVTLGVHIADVGHYVKQGSELDREAFERGTSVYFADQVAPMLPTELSNGICSLNPGVDRLTLSCLMQIDEAGEVLHYEITPAVIRSKERMTYHTCNLLLSGQADPALEQRYAHILPTLRALDALDQTLKTVRRRRGALDLTTTERAILCDAEGRPIEVVQKGAGRSEGIIESMMLLANETVARHLSANGLPGIYRIHEPPSEEKLTALKSTLFPLGFTLKGADHGSFQTLLKKSKGTPKQDLVNLLVLRAMMKASYSPENQGHFGLAAEYYCHFTSPIRRYPDLVVNRILHAALAKKGPAAMKRLSNFAKTAAIQSSEREIAAMTAEREIEKLYLAEYMEAHVGEKYLGTVSGVTNFGLFLALPNGVEGLLPVRALPDDYYIYNEAHMTLIGEHTGRRYEFGMELPILCAAANGGLGQVDFLLLNEEGEPIPPRERRQPQRPATPQEKAERVIQAKKRTRHPRPPHHRAKKR